jgi:hypothetical protein
MQDLEPHMEDLLRRAAEAYPLKEGEDKWNEIASKLSLNSTLPVSRKNWWQQNRYYILLFPVLMSFSLLLNEYQVKNKSAIQKQTITPDGNALFNNSATKATKRVTNHEVFNSITTTNNKTTFNHFNTDQRLSTNEAIKEEKSFITTIPVRNSNPLSDLTSSENTSLNGVVLNSSIAELKTELPEKSSSKAIPHISGKGFYYGLIGGLHMNAIKDEGFKKTGFDIGLLGGYRFSPEVSIESGILFARKYYWTSGKNFDMSGMGSSMPSGMDMLEVHGSSQIIEIPLHVRYDFAHKKAHRFYSLAGFSSYILTEENNQYDYMLNGTQGKMSGSYEQNQSYFASCIDFALGYEKNLGYKTRLRIEPYIQLPVDGIGVGHLLVKSAGLRFGITNSLH